MKAGSCVRLMLAVAVLASGSSAFAEAGPACDRQCLLDHADKYLTALTAHDAASLPLDEGIIFTENTIRLNTTEGLWESAGALGPFKVVVPDVTAQQVGLLVSLTEKGRPRLLAARLMIARGRISEIETIVAREGMTSIPPPENAAERATVPIFVQPLSPEEKRSRAEMLYAANQYFEGIEQNTGEIVPFDEACNRVENAIQTTNNPALLPPGAPTDSPMAKGCRDQFNAGGMFWTLPERRIWAVDEENGNVIGAFTFRSKLPDVIDQTVPAGLRPLLAHNTIAEMFKIKDGRIHQIEAVIGPMLPYGQRSGW